MNEIVTLFPAKLTHPTPIHIRRCIMERILSGTQKGQEALPLWVMQAVSDGIADACREHDASPGFNFGAAK